MPMAYESGRLVTTVWRINGSGYAWLGYCSVDVATGDAVVMPTTDLVPSGWLATEPFLSSDGDRLYLAGAQLAGVHSTEYSTPAAIGPRTMQRAEQGIFAFDAVTLDPIANWVIPAPLNQSGYILTETPPR